MGRPRKNWVDYCHLPSCDSVSQAKGLCWKHYQQKRRHGRCTPELEREYYDGPCVAPGCEGKPVQHGLCKRHAGQVARHGCLTPDTERKGRPLVNLHPLAQG